MAGNICRCGTCQRIRIVKALGDELRDGSTSMRDGLDTLRMLVEPSPPKSPRLSPRFRPCWTKRGRSVLAYAEKEPKRRNDVSTLTNALAVALILGSLSACQSDNEPPSEGGGGGGRTMIDRDELPDSNNVNPSPQPDTFMEPENRGKLPTP